MILSLALLSVSLAAAEPQSTDEEIRLRATVQEIVPLTSFSGKVIPVDADPMFALTVRIVSADPATTRFKVDSAVTFAIHSPSRLFIGRATPGKTYDFSLRRETENGKVRFLDLRLRKAPRPGAPGLESAPMSASDSPSPAERRLYELWSEYRDLDAAEALLEWDQETYLPSGAHDTRGEVLSTVAALKHRCLVAPELLDLLAECAEQAEEGSVLAAQVLAARREVDRAVKIPESLKREIAAARSAGLAAWQAARQASDFSLFERPLARMLRLRREEGVAVAGDGDPYDALLDRYEPGARSAELEPLFRDLVDTLTPLVGMVTGRGDEVDESAALGHFPGDLQVELGRRVAAAVGYDFEAGRLDPSAHPFCVRIHRRDVRMTYRFQEDDFRPCLFGILHECGHGLYEQGLPEARHRTPVDDAVSLGVHESQSLLWENHVGRSRGFWRWLAPLFRETFPAAAAFDAEEIWPVLHTVKPSLIRVDADETTYNLHVAVRFELELELFRGELGVPDLPWAWNDRYERYLGIRPAHDAEGVLQDVHWAQGSFGYFPTYTLGMLTAAQLAAAARRDLGDLDTAFAAGEFRPLLGWLREHLHGQGRLYPSGELIARATGRPLDTDDFVAYLRRNAAAVYGVTPP